MAYLTFKITSTFSAANPTTDSHYVLLATVSSSASSGKTIFFLSLLSQRKRLPLAINGMIMYGTEPVLRQTPMRPMTWTCLNRLIIKLSSTNLSTAFWSKSPAIDRQKRYCQLSMSQYLFLTSQCFHRHCFVQGSHFASVDYPKLSYYFGGEIVSRQ